jgi:hypothetical protein
LREVFQHRSQLVFALMAADEVVEVISPLFLSPGRHLGVP